MAIRPARRSVILPLGVHRAEIAARGHVVGADVHADPEGFQHAAADVELQRIVTEEAPDGPGRSRA